MYQINSLSSKRQPKKILVIIGSRKSLIKVYVMRVHSNDPLLNCPSKTLAIFFLQIKSALGSLELFLRPMTLR